MGALVDCGRTVYRRNYLICPSARWYFCTKAAAFLGVSARVSIAHLIQHITLFWRQLPTAPVENAYKEVAFPAGDDVSSIARDDRIGPDLTSARRLLVAAGALISDASTRSDHQWSFSAASVEADFLLDVAISIISSVYERASALFRLQSLPTLFSSFSFFFSFFSSSFFFFLFFFFPLFSFLLSLFFFFFFLFLSFTS